MGSEPIARRKLILGACGLAFGAAGYRLARRRAPDAPPGSAPRPAVFIARGQRYDRGLERTIRDGLGAVGLDLASLRGRSVLLKPNLVEPSRSSPHVTTHPAIVVAAAEVFRSLGARVVVGEGPGHVRDTEMALIESGLEGALDAAGLEFADLNYSDPVWAANRGRSGTLKGFYLPRPAAEADVIVSLPKLKTHHWIGMTGSLKNLFGVLPGHVYGWPKNILHQAGIPQSVADLFASLPPAIGIVDAIDCMEGDGPIMGDPKAMGLVLVGADLPTLDATCARLMGLDPARLDVLRLAAGDPDRLGDLAIEQRGEPWRPLASPFRLIDAPHLEGLRPDGRSVGPPA